MVGDVLRDAHMQSRCVTQLTIVTFRPQVRIAGSMDELDSDPSPLAGDHDRSEEHTSELQSPRNLVCRLLLEKKKNIHLLLLVRSHLTQFSSQYPSLTLVDADLRNDCLDTQLTIDTVTLAVALSPGDRGMHAL